ncbi:hypothetical protein GCM10028796_47600 [Ramlibacter monticola]|uniref:Glycosyltransferase n=1 Tax=Ramlibacter monticola TaxID=1926872 RepID=A0A937CSZ7_9BURK|nr:glycosyltransferase [Ramlibacter monticola]MBL0391068.1 glycosyltransferase [Ramlibacter monticola]
MSIGVSAFTVERGARSGSEAAGGRVFLGAAGVHFGGGRILLEALVHAMEGTLQEALIDERVRGGVAFPRGAQINFVGQSPLARCLGLSTMAARMTRADVLFCFNGLPPLARPAGRVVSYLQASYLIAREPGVRYGLVTRARIALERLWLRAAIRNCDEIWVQTPSMARAVLARIPGVDVRVVPVVDEELAKLLPALERDSAQAVDYGACSFIFPADAMPHKNHAHLLQAWALLASQGQFPKLYLTLREPEFDAVLRSAGLVAGQIPSVENLGRLPRPQVLKQMRASSALLFPSRTESFGLPMLEARALGVPVLAAERDFVRDVCEPAQTFDPGSPVSIAAAVRRFVEGRGAPETRYYSAADLVQRLLSRTAP